MNKVYDKESIVTLLKEEENIDVLVNTLLTLHPYDIANAFLKLDDIEKKRIINILPPTLLADIFSYIDEVDAADILTDMDKTKSSEILNEMDIDDLVDVVQQVSDPSTLTELLDNDVLDDVSDLTVYDEGSAGSIMTTNYITLNQDMDVKEAMKKVVSQASIKEIIETLFVLKDDALVGVISLKDLIIARSPMKISEIMNTNFESVEVDCSIEEVNKIINQYDIYALPVLEKNILMGVITIDDAMDTIDETMEQDYMQMAAVNNVEQSDSIFKSFVKRMPWLIVLLLLSLIVSNVLSIYDHVISQVVVLAFFQTMLLDMAGNIGTQSLGVTIQKMTDNELSTKTKELKHIVRETLISLLNSFILCIVSFVVCNIFLLIRYNTIENQMLICVVIALSLFMTLLFSGLVATILPLILKKLRIDPAIASGPFITALNDIVSIIIYFNIAIVFLNLVV